LIRSSPFLLSRRSCGGDSVGDRCFLGHLGHGVMTGPPVCFPKRVAVSDRIRAVKVRQVAARGYHSMLLTTDGHVYNFGCAKSCPGWPNIDFDG
jgi:hypothetical protein